MISNNQQPTANSQQPTANSQQPTANSQQPTGSLSEKIIEQIFKSWEREAKMLGGELARIRPRLRHEDIDDVIIVAGQILFERPPVFKSMIHARKWMRRTCRNLLRNIPRNSQKISRA